MTEPQTAAKRRPHVVIIGGGFGGLSAAKSLKRANVDVTLIDRHIYNTFQPLLYQVATASLNPGDITYFLRAIRSKQKNIRYLAGVVNSMDHKKKQIYLDGNMTVEYDYLIIANGVTANFFGVPGAEEFTIPLYKRSQALQVRDELFARFEDFSVNGQERDLRILMVGGGATGVEIAGALAEMRNLDMPTTYPELDRSKIHVTLVEMGPYLLAPFAEPLRNYTAEQLTKRDVDIRLNTAVKEVRENGVVIEHAGQEQFLEAEVIIWTSGVTVHESVSNWEVPQGKGGRILVDEHVRVQGLDGVYAVGDVSLNPDAPLAQLGQPAIQGGRHAAKMIKSEVSGKKLPKPFKYFDKGTMATIGRHAAIAEVNHLPSLRGFIAWLMWGAVHVAFLVTNQNRFSTMVNLSTKYMFRRSHNAIVGETPYAASQEHKIISGRNLRLSSDELRQVRKTRKQQSKAQHKQREGVREAATKKLLNESASGDESAPEN